MDYFHQRVLTGTINKRKVVPGLFKELFFKRRPPSRASTFDLEIISGGKTLVPFVTPVEGGTLMHKKAREMQTVTAPRMRPKLQYSANELLEITAPGESPILAPGVQPVEIERAVAGDMQSIKDDCELTLEYMCSQALCGGKISVDQDNIQFEIDFQMPAAHKIVLGAGATWDVATVDPSEDMNTWADLIIEECGMAPVAMICGTNAAQAFKRNPFVEGDLDNRNFNIGELSPRVGQLRFGHYEGVDCFRYGGQFTDAAGNPALMMHPDYVLLGVTDADASIEFGMPADLENSGPNEYFAKSKIRFDPSGIEYVSETRPLPWPKRMAYVYAKVV